MSSIHTKLLKFQKEVEAIKKDNTNPHFKSRFFDINSLLEEVLPKLNTNGLVLTQRPLAESGGRMQLLTVLTDAETGDSISSSMWLPETGKPQDYGSALTYYRRYSLQAMLWLMAEDDDGNTASGRGSDSKPAGSGFKPSSGGFKR